MTTRIYRPIGCSFEAHVKMVRNPPGIKTDSAGNIYPTDATPKARCEIRERKDGGSRKEVKSHVDAG